MVWEREGLCLYEDRRATERKRRDEGDGSAVAQPRAAAGGGLATTPAKQLEDAALPEAFGVSAPHVKAKASGAGVA